MMTIIMVISIIIVLVIILLSALTTSKAYSYKHTVDPIENNPYLNPDENQVQHEKTQK